VFNPLRHCAKYINCTKPLRNRVIRLYNFQYNPTELIWVHVKREVGEKNTTLKLADIQQLVSDVTQLRTGKNV
jgi:hypothetical protein